MSYYQNHDAHSIDYQIYELPGIRPYPGGGFFRGPMPPLDRPYIACLGAAQTFGRFCERPFPALLQETLGIGALNLGFGAAAPTFFYSNQKLLEYVNRGKLAIVQILSGRSQSNSLFQIHQHGPHGIRISDNAVLSAAEFFEDLLRASSVAQVQEVVEETRHNYVQDMITLLRHVTCPKILFWFSVRTPEYQEKYELPVWQLFGNFPQLVNQGMVDSIREHADRYVQVVSSVGLPQKLYDKLGQPTSADFSHQIREGKQMLRETNNYYPSPEMHKLAARELYQACMDILND